MEVADFIKVKGFSKLTEQQQQLFVRVYKRHLAAWGTEMRKKYELKQLKEIKWSKKENCLHVFWKGDTDWFHYDTRGCWY
ncbi:hypothetical protein BKP45_04990 [Anaerobacillus alkalidiazotrophicus]|uniref:Uncharacterized protein n=1 Tax=Anaerobacillus alkalidiazotrophicus TaxID=472963 RepID=A0A1S2MBS0_9BACI|nr:hypothetical protein [Anaerobacillus alkalidiazotrophicus]OIJ22036.1 hypothetical protein BKP45_04990 [Anaerobacillus alkalidiazotrophicus]